ncbi:MAG: class I SAM-dependent methyltransferase [Lachnospiraceae bacterium]
MFNKFIQNTRKPEGVLGRFMLKGMNSGHAKMAEWGFSHLILPSNSHILDVGCGGGANIAKMLLEAKGSVVDGLDYSQESVAFSKKKNAANVGKRCTIRQGTVTELPYEDNELDLVTAFETIYFWPDLDEAFKEIQRTVKDEGTFFICCESDDAKDTTWTSRIEGMKVYSGDDLKSRLINAGFKSVEVHRNEKGWTCINAAKQKEISGDAESV